MDDVITGFPVKYLFTYIDSAGNRKLYNFPSWPETYQSAVNSIKHNFGLDISFIFQTGKVVAEDDKTWEELSKKVKEGMEKGETAIIVTVLEKKP